MYAYSNIPSLPLTMVCPSFDYVKAICLLFNLIGVLIYGIAWLVIGTVLLLTSEGGQAATVAYCLLTAYGFIHFVASVIGFVALSEKVKCLFYIVRIPFLSAFNTLVHNFCICVLCRGFMPVHL
nr:hypothetical transcript [Hymenolepis microstoma]